MDVWFVETFVNSNKSLEIIDFLEKLKKHSKFSVRLSSDCGQNDYSFSLSGSNVAIDLVTKPYFDMIGQKNKDAENEKKKLRDNKLMFELEVSERSIKPLNAITLYPEFIYIKPEENAYW